MRAITNWRSARPTYYIIDISKKDPKTYILMISEHTDKKFEILISHFKKMIKDGIIKIVE